MRLARDRSPFHESAGLVAAAPPSAPPDNAGLDAHERSFCEVYYRLHPRLLAVAERYVDRETARDVRSESMLDFWRRWPQLTAEQRADAYLFRAVKNTAFDALKAQGEVLEAALAAMPPCRRAVLRLLCGSARRVRAGRAPHRRPGARPAANAQRRGRS